MRFISQRRTEVETTLIDEEFYKLPVIHKNKKV